MGLWDYGIMGLWDYGIMGLWDLSPPAFEGQTTKASVSERTPCGLG
ncbi:hypothetical protein [Helicobacter felis]|nr:hypothetical protein [Helicobacter felis]